MSLTFNCLRLKAVLYNSQWQSSWNQISACHLIIQLHTSQYTIIESNGFWMIIHFVQCSNEYNNCLLYLRKKIFFQYDDADTFCYMYILRWSNTNKYFDVGQVCALPLLFINFFIDLARACRWSSKFCKLSWCHSISMRQYLRLASNVYICQLISRNIYIYI